MFAMCESGSEERLAELAGQYFVERANDGDEEIPVSAFTQDQGQNWCDLDFL